MLERVLQDVREDLAAPELERAAERGGALPGVRERGSPHLRSFEDAGIELLVVEPDRVTAAGRDDPVRAEQPAKRRHSVVERLARRPGLTAGPDVLGEYVARDGQFRPEEQHGEEHALPSGRRRYVAPVPQDLKRAED